MKIDSSRLAHILIRTSDVGDLDGWCVRGACGGSSAVEASAWEVFRFVDAHVSLELLGLWRVAKLSCDLTIHGEKTAGVSMTFKLEAAQTTRWVCF